MAEQISFDYLKEMAEGEEEVIREMTEIFKGQVPELIEKMENALAAKDYDKLRETAHRAKSSVAILGLNDLSESMKTLEQNAEAKTNVHTYDDYVELFKTTCNKALEDLQTLGY